MKTRAMGLWAVLKFSPVKSGEDVLLIVDANGETVAEVPTMDDPEKELATANLIAAAPDLLECCKEALIGVYRSLEGRGSESYDPVEEAVKLRTAIRKAEGRE